jgi:hypothetical protein
MLDSGVIDGNLFTVEEGSIIPMIIVFRFGYIGQFGIGIILT